MLLQIEKFFRICRIKSKIYSNLLSRICEFTVSKRRPTSTIKSSIYVSTSAFDLYLPTTGNTELPFEARRNGGPPAEDLVHIAAMFRWTKSVRDRYKRDYPSYASCDREISWPHCVRERVVAHTRMTCVCVCVNTWRLRWPRPARTRDERREGSVIDLLSSRTSGFPFSFSLYSPNRETYRSRVGRAIAMVDDSHSRRELDAYWERQLFSRIACSERALRGSGSLTGKRGQATEAAETRRR